MDEKHFIGHRKRLKQRFLKHKDSLEDYEILELLLGYALPRKDTKPIAKALLNRFTTLKGVLTARQNELKEIPGVGDGIILFWRLWQEFWSRIEKDEVIHKKSIFSPYDIFKIMSPKIGFSPKESFWILLLDNKNRLIEEKELFKGTVDQAVIYLREVLATALKHDASGIILIHNHPGGDPTPSKYDIDITRRIQDISKELEIRILDHIIIAEEQYFSFKERGIL